MKDRVQTCSPSLVGSEGLMSPGTHKLQVPKDSYLYIKYIYKIWHYFLTSSLRQLTLYKKHFNLNHYLG